MSKYDNFQKMFEKRAAYAFFFFISFCLFSVLRISVVSSSREYAEMQTKQSLHRITVARNRGTIYDTNMIPLTNNKCEEYVAVAPVADAVMDVPSFLFGEEKERVLDELKENKVAVVKPKGKVTADSIVSTKIYSTDEKNFIAEHIIGYTDASGHGVCGLEKAYDDVLYRENTVDVLYEIDGKGGLLYGKKPIFDNNLSDVFDGIRLTLDIKIQQIAAECTKELKKGACVISECSSGKIRAVLSKPDYSPFEIEKSLSDADSPMLNRALIPFAVGSVFKPCVAIAGIQSGNKDFLFDCKGKTRIIDRDFSCHRKEGHGVVDLKNAIAFSCNTFFYNFGIKTGARKILETASVFGFGNKIKLADNFYADGGSLMRESDCKNDAMVANFSIGQGDLTLSPVSMLNLYTCIANGGFYVMPSIVESTVSGGKETPYKTSGKTRVMSQETAEHLKETLKCVVTSGTGTAANVENVRTAGKTATAQTGRYGENGREITNAWFCGFFPADEPKYAVVIMSDGESSVSVAEMFGRIAEKISSDT